MVFEKKTGYKLYLQSQEAMELLRSTEKEIDKDKNREHVPKLKIVEVVFIHCNVFNNDYKQVSKLLFNFVPNKQLGQLDNSFNVKYY